MYSNLQKMFYSSVRSRILCSSHLCRLWLGVKRAATVKSLWMRLSGRAVRGGGAPDFKNTPKCRKQLTDSSVERYTSVVCCVCVFQVLATDMATDMTNNAQAATPVSQPTTDSDHPDMEIIDIQEVRHVVNGKSKPSDLHLGLLVCLAIKCTW